MHKTVVCRYDVRGTELARISCVLIANQNRAIIMVVLAFALRDKDTCVGQLFQYKRTIFSLPQNAENLCVREKTRNLKDDEHRTPTVKSEKTCT